MDRWNAVELRLAAESKRLPYRQEPDDDVHEMIWLTQQPDRIHDIPELQRDPALKKAISAINAAGLRFETFRCGSNQETHDGKINHFFNIGFIYRDREAFANYGAQLMVAGELLGFAMESGIFEPGEKPFLFELQQVALTTEGARGWTMDIWHQSIAASADEAREKADRALDLVSKVLSSAFQ
ncbi:hypothetical protein [Pseudomonas monteilii]|uniref:hypothetical protein n=1 Tax=Pseudomonas monteilii TaxID=76759 RepID=UPI001E4FD68D|nr:hypothetical protein [Pseudomonas monteilii]WJO30971.1 hypothetical protein LU690_18015 [Pseudomonas monteilii]